MDRILEEEMPARNLDWASDSSLFEEETWPDLLGKMSSALGILSALMTENKIYKWIEQGLTDREIFLIWNQGNTRQCKSGVNKYGVKYDSCEYVEKALQMLH